MWDGLAALMMILAGFGSTWLVQATVLLAFGLLAGQLLSRSGPAVLSGIYRTTLAAILICPVASAVLIGAGVDGLALRWPGPVHEPVTATRSPVVSRPVVVAREPDRPDVLFDRDDRPLERAPRARGEEATAVVAKPMPLAPTPRPSPRLTRVAAVAVGFAVWGLGATIIGLRLWLGLVRMRRLRGTAVPAEPDAAALCRDVAWRMNVEAPTVRRSPFLFSPCLDGLRRPAILLPDDVDENLVDIFVHELAHLVRRDGFWNLLRRSAGVVFWVHPLFWVLTRRLEAVAEEVCDDYVVQFGGDRARYAGHLLELAGRALPPVAPAVVGMISLRSMLARRIVRILDTSRTLSTRAGTRAVLVMLAVGLVGTVFAGLLGVAGGERKAKAQSPTKATAATLPSKPEIIRGRVVGPNGRPIPGATVVASRSRLVLNGIGDVYQTNKRYLRVSLMTDQDGRFEFDIRSLETDPDRLEDWGDVQVFATAPGFGFGVLSNGSPIRLTADDLPINGRLVDLEGRPTPGVRVELGQVWVPAPGIAEGTVSRSKPWSMAGRLGLDLAPLLPEGVVTDADGRFRIEGLGRDALTSLTLSGPSIAFKRAKVVTRVMDPVADEPRDAAFAYLDDPVTYGADCTIAVAPTRPIEGFVRDAETKEPIQGAVVTAAALSNANMTIDGLIMTETDAQGHYRLVGLPKESGKGHKLAVYPPLDQPYFITDDIEVPARPGFDAVHRDIALRRGTWVTGKVTDLKTGEPVNAVVDYFPFLTNEHAKDYPNFDPGTAGSVRTKTRYRTDRAGRFRTVALPGRGVVTARVDRGPYRTGFGAEMIAKGTRKEQLLTYDHIYPSLYQGLREVEVPEGAASFSCDLPLDPGETRRLRLVDPAGMPVTNVNVIGRLPDTADFDQSPRAESVITIRGLEPGKTRTVVIRYAASKLGAILTVPAEGSEEGDEVTVTLRPDATVTARFVDDQGKPFTGYVQVRLIPSVVSLHDEINITDLPLDADGRFRYEELPSGGPYRLWVINKPGSYARAKSNGDEFTPFELSGDLKVEPGQLVDFGTYDVTTGKPIEPQPTKTAYADVPINGRIVDLEGGPVSGASVRIVSTAVPKSGSLDNWMAAVRGGETPITARRHIDFVSEPAADPREVTTDAQGRFQFQGVAPERLVHLAVRGPTIATAMFTAATRQFGPIAARGFRSNSGTGSETIFGADFTFTATPSRLVEGTVRDSRTRQPLAGVEIQSNRVLISNGALMPILKTVADELGRFRLAGLPKGIKNIIIAVPGEDQPYLTREVTVPDSPGIAPISVDVELHRGLWIEGKVTDNVTGRPIEGARLHYFPFLDNKYAQALPEFHPGGGRIDRTVLQHQYTTKPDGTYRMVGVPGHAIVGVDHGERLPYRFGFGAEAIGGMDARGYFPTWRSPGPPGRPWPLSMKEIDPAEGTEVVRMDLQLDPGASVRVRAIDPQGQPLTGLKVMRRSSMGSLELVPRAEFDVVALGAGEERRVAIWHEGRDLGKVVPIRQGDDKEGPVVLVLEPMATIVGRVLDSDGQPVSGATVEPRPLPEIDFNLRLPGVTTDKEGRFRTPSVPVGYDYRLWAESRDRTIKDARGSSETVKVRPGETTDVGDIRLKRGNSTAGNAARPDVPINGRIVDLEGRPVAGVSVKVEDVQASKSSDLSPWIEGVRNGEPPWIAFHHNKEIKVPESVEGDATTDADGRFRFEGLGGERVVELSIAGDTIAYTRITVATKRIESFPASGFADQYGSGTQTVYGADFTFTTSPSRPIEGVVRDARTKQPLTGVSVESDRFAGSNYAEIRTLKSVTDEHGRFQILGMPKGKGNGIIAVPNDDQPYFMREVKVGDPSGIASVAVEIELHRGILIAGKITDKLTGKPVGDARLHYLPFLENSYVQALPEFQDGNVDGFQLRYTTKADGTYRLVGMPGRAIVGVESVGKTPYRTGVGAESISGRDENGHYKTWNNPIRPSLGWPNTLVEINLVEGTEKFALDAQLDPGLSVRLKVVDTDGNPLDDASVEQGNRFHATERAPDGSFELVSLRPDEVRTAVIRHVGRKLGTVARLRPADDANGPVVVPLTPLASIKGPTVDADANPVSAALVRITVESTDSFIHTFAEVVSDREGRFEVPNVPAGCRYGLGVESGVQIKKRRFASAKAVVKPGETTDVGDIVFKND